MLQTLLTTTDNPYDPFDEYDEWLAFDLRKGYNTISFLARMVVTSDEFSDSDQHDDIERAIDEIVSENILGLYKKVSRDIPETSEL